LANCLNAIPQPATALVLVRQLALQRRDGPWLQLKGQWELLDCLLVGEMLGDPRRLNRNDIAGGNNDSTSFLSRLNSRKSTVGEWRWQ